MKISKKEDTGLIFMSILAKEYSPNYVPLSRVAKMANISPLFLKQLASLFLSSRLLSSKEGADGGYKLTRSPEKINVAEIIKAVSGKIVFPSCQKKDCRISREDCSCYFLWDKLDNTIFSYLSKISLAEFSDPGSAYI